MKGGSTAVRGKQVLIEAQAFMATESDADDSGTDTDRTNLLRNSNEDEPRRAALRTSFYDEDYDRGKRVVLPVVTNPQNVAVTHPQFSVEKYDREQRVVPPAVTNPRNVAVTHPPNVQDEDDIQEQRVVSQTPSRLDDETVPQPTTVVNQTGQDADDDMVKARVRIAYALNQRDYVPDFRCVDIPTRQENAQLHDRLHDLIHQRDAIETQLMNMLSDVTADGLPLDPKRDIEDAYHAASAAHNQRNRDMWHAFTQRNTPTPTYNAPLTPKQRVPLVEKEESKSGSSSAIPPSPKRQRRSPTGKQTTTGKEDRANRERTFYDAMPRRSNTGTREWTTTTRRVEDPLQVRLRGERTTSLWNSLRRACFGETEDAPVPTRAEMAIELLRVVQLAERQGGTQRRVIDVEADDDSRTRTATRQPSPHLIVIEDGESDTTTTDDSTDQVVANVATEDKMALAFPPPYHISSHSQNKGRQNCMKNLEEIPTKRTTTITWRSACNEPTHIKGQRLRPSQTRAHHMC